MFPLWFPNPFFELACFTNRALQSFDLFIPTSWTNLMWLFFKTNVSIKMQFFGKNTDTEYWYFSFFLVLILIMFSVFFMVNTDIDTSVFKICTEYWILVLLFCTGHFSGINTTFFYMYLPTIFNHKRSGIFWLLRMQGGGPGA